MKALILKNFVDKNTEISYTAELTADFEAERAKALSALGYVKILDDVIEPVKDEITEKKEEPEKVEKAEKVEKLPTKKAPAKPKTKK